MTKSSFEQQKTQGAFPPEFGNYSPGFQFNLSVQIKIAAILPLTTDISSKKLTRRAA